MKIISIASRRGGVGKTITALNLGCGLIKRGKKVLFVDLDSQCNLSFDLKANYHDKSFTDYIKRYDAELIQVVEGKNIIASNENLSGADIDLGNKNNMLRDLLGMYSKKFDYAIIDTPPALGSLTINSLTAADYVIIPVRAEIHSLQGLSQVASVVNTIKKTSNKKLKIAGIFITKFNPRTNLSQSMTKEIEEMARRMGTSVFNAKIRQCNAIEESETLQTNIFDYAPRSNGAIDFEQFVDEFTERIK